MVYGLEIGFILSIASWKLWWKVTTNDSSKEERIVSKLNSVKPSLSSSYASVEPRLLYTNSSDNPQVSTHSSGLITTLPRSDSDSGFATGPTIVKPYWIKNPSGNSGELIVIFPGWDIMNEYAPAVISANPLFGSKALMKALHVYASSNVYSWTLIVKLIGLSLNAVYDSTWVIPSIILFPVPSSFTQ